MLAAAVGVEEVGEAGAQYYTPGSVVVVVATPDPELPEDLEPEVPEVCHNLTRRIRCPLTATQHLGVNMDKYFVVIRIRRDGDSRAASNLVVWTS